MRVSAQGAEESCPAAVRGALVSGARVKREERMCARAGSEGQLASCWRGRWVGAPLGELADEGRGDRASSPHAAACRWVPRVDTAV